MTKKKPKAEPYRPSNGTEGELFRAQFCEKCVRDRLGNCGILTKTMAFDITDANYPKQWITDPVNGPRCTSFSDHVKPRSRLIRDRKQMRLPAI